MYALDLSDNVFAVVFYAGILQFGISFLVFGKKIAEGIYIVLHFFPQKASAVLRLHLEI